MACFQGYHSLGDSVILEQIRAEGNAGNQIKVTGALTMTNSMLLVMVSALSFQWMRMRGSMKA
ncbi:MAG: hypothetical protein D6790_19370 [Caldilineae bacterium]|nr:MAG: hypothetical protein D6790_19370 [Caldilineae bacterium]